MTAPLHRLFLLAALALADPATAEIRSADDCNAAITADPAVAREDAAIWYRLGGGTAARLCEAAALEAMGADLSAAALLTRLAENPNRALAADVRVVLFTDAARLWLAGNRPELTLAALASADRLAAADPERLLLRARAEAATGDWAAAHVTLDRLLAAEPANALAHALRAASLRRSGDPAGALTEAEAALALDPDLPEALFETAAALAETGEADRAADLWLTLIERHPDHDLAALARRNLQSLN